MRVAYLSLVLFHTTCMRIDSKWLTQSIIRIEFKNVSSNAYDMAHQIWKSRLCMRYVHNQVAYYINMNWLANQKVPACSVVLLRYCSELFRVFFTKMSFVLRTFVDCILVLLFVVYAVWAQVFQFQLVSCAKQWKCRSRLMEHSLASGGKSAGGYI